MFAYGVYQFGAFLAHRLSLPTARKLAASVGSVSSVLQARNRVHLYRNLQAAFGDELSPRELRGLRRRIYENFGSFVLDFLRLPDINSNNIGEMFTDDSMEAVDRLGRLAGGDRPVMSITGHVGHWEMGAAAMGIRGHDLTIIADMHPSKNVTKFFDGRRKDKGITVVPVTAFHRCFRAMRNRKLVAIVCDRPVTGQGIVIDFFGRPTLIPDGPALLARRFNALMVPTFCIMQDDGRYRFMIEDPIETMHTDDERADIRECAQRYVKIVERYASSYADQWYVFRPVWRGTRARTADREMLRDKRARTSAPRRPAGEVRTP